MITSANFTGKFYINPGTYGTDKLNDFINDIKVSTLYDLLGKDLAVLFIANDESARFQAIKNEFYAEDVYGHPYRSAGMVDMLKCFVYFDYVRNASMIATNGNIIANQSELSANVVNFTHLTEMYNRGVRTYKSIQMYIEDNLETYPEFSGIKRTLIF
jgi:hypothetical protein